MTVMIVLIVCSLSLAAIFLASFFWAVKSNQFEDTYTPSLRILLDDKNSSGSEEN